MKTLLAVLLIAGFAFAWNGTPHMRDLNSTLSMIECRTNSTIGLLDNQSNLSAYASALQKDEASLAGFAASGDAKSFFSHLRGSYLPDLKAAFSQRLPKCWGRKRTNVLPVVKLLVAEGTVSRPHLEVFVVWRRKERDCTRLEEATHLGVEPALPVTWPGAGDWGSRSSRRDATRSSTSAVCWSTSAFDSASLARALSIPAKPLSRYFCSSSSTVTSNPAIAATCAMPEPINPKPSTPTFLISI